MTSEAVQPKKLELSTAEIIRQNRESYDYLRSLVSQDETPLKIDEVTDLRFFKGGKPLRGRFDKVQVTFQNRGNQIATEFYKICEGGLIEYGVSSEPITLSSGLETELHEYEENNDGKQLLKEEDRGLRTPAKVIADTVRERIEARTGA